MHNLGLTLNLETGFDDSVCEPGGGLNWRWVKKVFAQCGDADDMFLRFDGQVSPHSPVSILNEAHGIHLGNIICYTNAHLVATAYFAVPMLT